MLLLLSFCCCRVADQIELVFADADLVPLLVQENYVNHRPDISQGKPDLVSFLAVGLQMLCL